MANIINLGLRGLEFIWTLLIMSLIGNMIAEADNGNPSVVNYAMFVAVFAMLSLFYLIPAALKDSLAFHPLAGVVLDLLNTLFFFCGAVALAADLGAHSCSNHSYINTNGVTDGTNPGNRGKRCREAQASDAFLFFGFACFAASTVFSGLESRGGGGSVRPSGLRRGGPSMSQV